MTNLSKISRTDVKIVTDELSLILAEIIIDYQNRTGKILQPAHIERLLINTYAYRETLVRQGINEAYRQQHPRFATGLMLDLCGDDVNTPRLQAQPAQTTLRFSAILSGNQQVIIPIGTRVSVSELVFVTSTAAILTANNNSVDLNAYCQTDGLIGNDWSIGQISTLLDTLTNEVEVRVSNISVPFGGMDIETDDAYRERILLAPESFSVAGSRGAYEYFARQVSQSIIDVHVANDLDRLGLPLGGVVAVTILTNTGIPSIELINKVQTALSDERIRPLCDQVIVRQPEVIEYQISATLTIYEGINARNVIEKAKQAWNNYQQLQEKKLGLDVVPLVIQSLLKVDGVYNVITPDLNLIKVNPNAWAHCTDLELIIAEEVVDG